MKTKTATIALLLLIFLLFNSGIASAKTVYTLKNRWIWTCGEIKINGEIIPGFEVEKTNDSGTTWVKIADVPYELVTINNRQVVLFTYISLAQERYHIRVRAYIEIEGERTYGPYSPISDELKIILQPGTPVHLTE